MKHPMQPLEVDEFNVLRFKQNAIVRHLQERGGIDLNAIAAMDFSQDDRVQFAQLIGYSLSGFHELNYVPDAVALEASRRGREIMPNAGGCRDNGCPFHSGVQEEP